MRLLSRRNFVKLGALGAIPIGSLNKLKDFFNPGLGSQTGPPPTPTPPHDQGMEGMDGPGDMPVMMPGVNGEVDYQANGFDPGKILTDFDLGTQIVLSSGQIIHEYNIISTDKEIEVVPGIKYAAWVYNGRIPGPTIRVKEGEQVRIHFRNASQHSHSIHFHGIHPGAMDGVFELVQSGQTFTYEFDAEPAGVHLYHCHASPLADHIARGLYGAFIVDPKEGWSKVDHEFVMVMAGYDVNFDKSNEFYTVNGIPFYHSIHPIQVKTGESVRVFLINILEFDLINSFHLHGNFFNYYPTGTNREHGEFTDMITQGQGQRGILEFSFKFPGKYMFHAHVSEFADLGWMGSFEVAEA